MRHEPVGGHEADDAAPRGGQPDGAALVAAQRDVHHPAGHRGAGTGRRAAGDVLAVVRVERPAVVAHAGETRSAPGELLHLELAHDGRARIEEPRDHGGVEVRHVAVHHVRAERERDARERDVVLQRDRLARQRPRVRALHPAGPDERAQRILRLGGAAARVAIGEPERQAPLLHPHLVEGLERGDGVHHACLDHPRLRRGQVEPQRAAVLHHLVDVGSPQHGSRPPVPVTADGCGSIMPWTIVGRARGVACLQPRQEADADRASGLSGERWSPRPLRRTCRPPWTMRGPRSAGGLRISTSPGSRPGTGHRTGRSTTSSICPSWIARSRPPRSR